MFQLLRSQELFVRPRTPLQRPYNSATISTSTLLLSFSRWTQNLNKRMIRLTRPNDFFKQKMDAATWDISIQCQKEKQTRNPKKYRSIRSPSSRFTTKRKRERDCYNPNPQQGERGRGVGEWSPRREHTLNLKQSINSILVHLQNVLGRSASTVYAIALLASGQSSTITGTYAGQYIMQVFNKFLQNYLYFSLIVP